MKHAYQGSWLGMLFILALLFTAVSTHGHPLAPGLFSVIQQSSSDYRVSWKTPLRQVPGVSLAPQLPDDCQNKQPAEVRIIDTARVESWQMQCSDATLTGARFAVSGLANSPASVLLRLQLLDGRHFQQMLSAGHDTFIVPQEENRWSVFKNYLSLGIGHLLSGSDHVLFVIALTLLVGWGQRLIWTITLFTLGHSLTLGLAVLGYVHFPVVLIEALIALTIVMTATELIRTSRDTLFKRRPWLIAALFGLLHGMGFAGALSDIGLPQTALPLSLAAFNVGIEVGQLLIVAALLSLISLLQGQLNLQPNRAWRWLPGYAIGIAGAVWFWDRLGVFQYGGLFA